MKSPNFFIIGAPKSGTSALSQYLAWHPNIFMMKEKEANYWNDDFHGLCIVESFDEYLALFKHATADHIAVGEATVHYLHSTRALPRIREFCPEAKLIALLRHPADLAYSWHSQMLYQLYEDEPDFERAWALQGERAEGRHIPATCHEPKTLQYKAIASLGSQVERLYELFSREQVRLYLFDDFKASPSSVYEDALAFLGVPSDGRTEFPVINESKTHRHGWLASFTERPPEFWVRTAKRTRKLLGFERIGLLKRLRDLNRVPRKRPSMTPEFRGRLIEEFHPEIELLSAQLGRDLSPWLATAGEEADIVAG